MCSPKIVTSEDRTLSLSSIILVSLILYLLFFYSYSLFYSSTILILYSLSFSLSFSSFLSAPLRVHIRTVSTTMPSTASKRRQRNGPRQRTNATPRLRSQIGQRCEAVVQLHQKNLAGSRKTHLKETKSSIE